MSVLSLVQLNPEIGTDDSDYVSRLVDCAKEFVRSYCNLPVFPELAAGYSKSASGGTADISGLATNSFIISVNGSPQAEIALNLANCTTGAATATEMQTKIRAVDSDLYGFDEITVTYSGGYHTITSGRYGERSEVLVWFEELNKHVCQALRLSPTYGGTQRRGMAQDDALVQATASLVEQLYRRMGAEGMSSVSFHQGEFNATIAGIADPFTLAQLQQRRRLWC